jgi:hypothetical protein
MGARSNLDYPQQQQQQNSQYYGPQTSMRPGLGGYPVGAPGMQKMGPMSCRPVWGGQSSGGGLPPQGQPRYYPPGIGSQQQGPTPTLNQLLQSPNPDLRHSAGFTGVEYGSNLQQKMMTSDDVGSYGGGQLGWQRMGGGVGSYPAQPPQGQPGMQVNFFMIC